jgi:hypothetical protein
MPLIWPIDKLTPVDQTILTKMFPRYHNLQGTTTPTRRPDLCIAPHAAVIAGFTPPDRLLTITPCCFMDMTLKGMDPFTFQAPNGCTSLINIYLIGKTVSLKHFDESTRMHLCQLVFRMCGFVGEGDNVDISVTPVGTFEPSFRAGMKSVSAGPEWLKKSACDLAFDTTRPVICEAERSQIWQGGPVASSLMCHGEQIRLTKLQGPKSPAFIEDQIKAGKTSREIMKDAHVSPKTVAAIRKAMKNDEPMPEIRGRGRPSKMTQKLCLKDTRRHPPTRISVRVHSHGLFRKRIHRIRSGDRQ